MKTIAIRGIFVNRANNVRAAGIGPVKAWGVAYWSGGCRCMMEKLAFQTRFAKVESRGT